jgi:pyruvate dehydrogenase E2 component (dihydrolipoamide acetyltransferase)
MTGRPLLLLGTAAALVVGTHLVLTATPSASVDPAEPPAAVAAIQEAGQPAAATSSAGTRVREAPRVTSAPARVSMTPGPAFAGSGPARPGADSARTPKAATHAPAAAPAPAAEDPSIAPAPASIELALPGLPPDSVVPTARTGDTMGMKKILRALNGPKPAEGSAAP